MIVDPALAHMQERVLHFLDARLQPVAKAGLPKEMEDARVWKFGSAPKAAVGWIDRADEFAGDGGKLFLRKFRRGAVVQPGHKPRFEISGVLRDRLLLLRVNAGDVDEHVLETWAVETRLVRKICAAEKWHPVGSEEHRKRPSALLAKLLQGRHIKRVDVGPLLPVDLDVHKQLVHELGGVFLLKALVSHHVTPMAGCVAHGQQDGLVEPLRLLECLLTPRPPVDGIMLVLLEVGASFFAQTI